MKYMILLSGDLKVKGVTGDDYHPMPDTSEGSGRSLTIRNHQPFDHTVH